LKRLRILIVDDHEIIRQGLRAVLQTQAHWEVVGEASTGRQGVEVARELKPDLVIMDISMPDLNGLDAAREILREEPLTEILILTFHDSERLVRMVLESGARGYVLKSDATRDLVAAVEALSQHRPFFTAKIAHLVLEGYLKAGQPGAAAEEPTERLTLREREIVQLLAEGHSNKEVAGRLNISTKTVETHRSNIMEKLHIRSITELVRYAIRNKITDLNHS
jgi:DNA-binding NarL/FixJ family response regulator